MGLVFRQGKDGMRRVRWTSRVGGMAMLGVAALSAGFGDCAAGGKIPCKYDVEILQNDCGLFPSFIQAGGIAEDGAIAGMFEACSPPNDRGFLWLPDGTFIPITLPVSPFLYQLAAVDVNEAHQVVGNLVAPGYGDTGFLYEQGRITTLGTLPGGNYSEATALNQFGTVTGYAGNTSTGLPAQAFIFQDGVLTSLSPDLGTPTSRAYDISDDGTITGWTGQLGPSIDGVAFTWHQGTVTLLPTIPKAHSHIARAINSYADVVGEAYFETRRGGSYHRAYVHTGGTSFTIDPFPGDVSSTAWGINDHQVIIGSSSGPGRGALFIWADGDMRDLSDLVVSVVGMKLWTVQSINNAGQISADGSLLGHAAVFRLHPILPTLGDLNCDEHVDVSDIQLLLGAWGACAKPCDADLDGTGVVNGFDLAMLLANW